jgi:aspartate-semialdehyde dehydrogenase
MATERLTQKLVIAGASSLLGNELKSVLEESNFATWDTRLVDEDIRAGILTEAKGEAAIIQAIDDYTFHGAKYVFVTGSTAFGKESLQSARAAGAKIIDLSRASLSDPETVPWFPRIESVTGKTLNKNAKLFSVLSAAALAVTTLAFALERAGLRRLTVVLFEPVSEAGREGIEELETQTSQLLSFQNIGSPVFGTQAAFSLLPCYGPESGQNLYHKLLQIRAEISAAIGNSERDQKIALNLVHAPVFYGMTFSAFAELDEKADASQLTEACQHLGFSLVSAAEPGPTNVSVAGETTVYLRPPVRDAVTPGGWWFWGAADNFRLPAWSGFKLAEWLEA